MHFKQKRLLIASQPYNPIPIRTKQKTFIHTQYYVFFYLVLYVQSISKVCKDWISLWTRHNTTIVKGDLSSEKLVLKPSGLWMLKDCCFSTQHRWILAIGIDPHTWNSKKNISSTSQAKTIQKVQVTQLSAEYRPWWCSSSSSVQSWFWSWCHLLTTKAIAFNHDEPR